jgi:integrase
MSIPTVPDEEEVSTEIVPLEQAEELLRYLSTYEYASRKHALFKTMWHTGCRISGAISLDLGDFHAGTSDSAFLEFVNRRDEGTPLKNGYKSERRISISQELLEVLSDYSEGRRKPVTDKFGREPLFTTRDNRISRQRAYKDFTALTRPCAISGNCPHNREIPKCEAGRDKEKAYACPSSKSLHPIRRGSITYQINRGYPKEKLSERVDVSVEVLNKHYDARTAEEERQGRKQYLDLL